MASVRIVKNSPFWLAKLRWVDRGVVRETLRSTKVPASSPKETALAVAHEMEATLTTPRQEVNKEDFEKLVARLLHAANIITPHQVTTFVDFSAKWLDEQDVKDASRKRYFSAITMFAKSLGPLAKADMRKVTYDDLRKFYDSLIASGRSANTARFLLKTIKAIFRRAFLLQYLPADPGALMRAKSQPAQEREAFTPEDLACIFTHLKKFPEWEVAAHFGSLYGMRISDAINRRYDEIQEIAGMRCIRFIPQKRERSGKPVTLPLVGPLAELQGEGWITPRLRTLRNPSRIFLRLLAESGVEINRVARKGEGISIPSKSFHSFRHTVNSTLAAQGVDISVRQAICGHDSMKVSLGYTHADLAAMKKVLNGKRQG